MPLSVRQGVELFHLVFVGELGTKLDRSLYAVKGGCNLRFFFRSIRYSEALDIDVEKAAVDTLRRKVDRLLASAPLTRMLGAHDISLEGISRPKQTETTQRWKLSLRVGRADTHTKIEFSRRGLDEGVAFGVVDSTLTAGYGLPRTMTSHYGLQAAVEQKLRALIGRSRTQARDVFDLELLLPSGSAINLSRVDARIRREAQDRALSVDFDTFRAQVLSFLPVEHQRQYDAKGIWEEMVLRVVDALAEASR